MNKAPLIASIDVGTNSFHMICATVNSRGMLMIHNREKENVRLGTGSGDMKKLTEEAMQRGVNTLTQFAAFANSEGATIRAVATSAVREALNNHEFIKRVKDASGIDLEVVSGNEEARLIYIGALHALNIFKKKALVIDIGGGSTETVVGFEGNILFSHSEKLGTIRLTQKFFPTPEITDAEVEDCRRFVLGEWCKVLDSAREAEPQVFVGTSGTITNLVLMAKAMKGESIPEITNSITVNAKDILKVIENIVGAKTIQERLALPGIDPARVDILPAGALILERAILTLGINKITISQYALREGVLFDTLQKMKDIEEYHHLSSIRYDSVYNICNQFQVNLDHAEHVKKLALKMFDTLAPFHGYGFAEREILEASCLLHDIGYYISHDLHHKHSYYLISNCIMPGFTNDETEIIALIARYHRKSHPKKKHPEFMKLTKERQDIVKTLASMLRIAEGIDRRQNLLVKDIKIQLSAKEIDFILIPIDEEKSIEIELWGADRRKLMMQEIFGKQVNFTIG
jgi:exopolyphosphatase/guanosine-5'-triphosphate,3'-diphosphate pyrophosphatase